MCALVIGGLVHPPGLSAKPKRGANLIVTKLDGTRVSGELIAVRPDSLLLIGPDGKDETADLAGIATVRVVRKAPTLLPTVAGFAAGAAVGLFFVHDAGEDRSAFLGAAVVFGAGGALAGLGIGAGIGADAVFRVAGEPIEVVKVRLDRLKAFSREGRLRLVPAQPGPTPSLGLAPPATPSAGPPRPSRRPRFRLGLGTTFDFRETHVEKTLSGSFLFPGDVPAGEAGPFDMPVLLHLNKSGYAALGPISLAYEWTDRWLVEIELYFPKLNNPLYGNGLPSYTSTTDGKAYEGWVYFGHDASFASLLVGPVFRPRMPSPLDRHTVEIGVAAGAARVGVNAEYSDVGGGYVPWPAQHKAVLSARAHVAYDFYFVPALSLGVFVGYRYLEAEFSPETATSEVAFRDVTDGYPYHAEPIIRAAEMSFPSLTYSLTGVTYGIRLNFRL